MGDADTEVMKLAVCGLHLSGQPLNWQLTEAKAKLLQTCKSSSEYKLFAIKDPVRGITKPGMIYVTDGTGAQIHLEVGACKSCIILTSEFPLMPLAYDNNNCSYL
jgi:allophanate hydrolase